MQLLYLSIGKTKKLNSTPRIYIENQSIGSQRHSLFYIRLMKMKMYLLVGRMLHLMLVLGMVLFCLAGRAALQYLDEGQYLLAGLFGYFSLYGFTLLFFSQLDARSRYQNYKQVKDKIYEHGFQARIIKPFVYSRCQREAIYMASICLNKEKECRQLFRSMGFSWYHILPRLLIQHPSFFFTRKYWETTLFASNYQSRYFLW